MFSVLLIAHALVVRRVVEAPGATFEPESSLVDADTFASFSDAPLYHLVYRSLNFACGSPVLVKATFPSELDARAAYMHSSRGWGALNAYAICGPDGIHMSKGLRPPTNADCAEIAAEMDVAVGSSQSIYELSRDLAALVRVFRRATDPAPDEEDAHKDALVMERVARLFENAGDVMQKESTRAMLDALKPKLEEQGVDIDKVLALCRDPNFERESLEKKLDQAEKAAGIMNDSRAKTAAAWVLDSAHYWDQQADACKRTWSESGESSLVQAEASPLKALINGDLLAGIVKDVVNALPTETQDALVDRDLRELTWDLAAVTRVLRHATDPEPALDDPRPEEFFLDRLASAFVHATHIVSNPASQLALKFLAPKLKEKGVDVEEMLANLNRPELTRDELYERLSQAEKASAVLSNIYLQVGAHTALLGGKIAGAVVPHVMDAIKKVDEVAMHVDTHVTEAWSELGAALKLW